MARLIRYLFMCVLLVMSAFISLNAAHNSPRVFTVDSLEFDYKGLLQLRIRDNVQINSGESSGTYTIEEDSYETKESAPGPLSTSQEPLIYIMGRRIVLASWTLSAIKTTIVFYFENSLKDQPVILEDEDGNPIDKAVYTRHPYIIQRYFNAQSYPTIILGGEANYTKKLKKQAIEATGNVVGSGFFSRFWPFSSSAAQELPTAPVSLPQPEQAASNQPVNYQDISRLPEGAMTPIEGTEYVVEKVEWVTKTMEVVVAYGLKIPLYKIERKRVLLVQNMAKSGSAYVRTLQLDFENEDTQLFSTPDSCSFMCTKDPEVIAKSIERDYTRWPIEEAPLTSESVVHEPEPVVPPTDEQVAAYLQKSNLNLERYAQRPAILSSVTAEINGYAQTKVAKEKMHGEFNERYRAIVIKHQQAAAKRQLASSKQLSKEEQLTTDPHVYFEKDCDEEEEPMLPSKPLDSSYFKNMFAEESSSVFTKIVAGCAAVATLAALWHLSQ